MDCTCFRYIYSNIDYRDPGERTKLAREMVSVYRKQGEDDFSIFMRLSNFHIEAGVESDCPLTMVLSVNGEEKELGGSEDLSVLDEWGEAEPCSSYYKDAYRHPKNHCCLLCSLSNRYVNSTFEDERAVVCNLIFGRLSVGIIRKIKNENKSIFNSLINAFEGDASHLNPLVIRGFGLLAEILINLEDDKADAIIGTNKDSDSIINLLIPYMSSAINANCIGALNGVAFDRSDCKHLLYELLGTDFIKDAPGMPVSESVNFINKKINEAKSNRNPDIVLKKDNREKNIDNVSSAAGDSIGSDPGRFKVFEDSDEQNTVHDAFSEESGNVELSRFSDAFKDNELTEEELNDDMPFKDPVKDIDGHSENTDHTEDLKSTENNDGFQESVDVETGRDKADSYTNTSTRAVIADIPHNKHGYNYRNESSDDSQWSNFPVLTKEQLSSAVEFKGSDITLKIKNILSKQKVFYAECYFGEDGVPVLVFYMDKVKTFYYTCFNLKASRGHLSALLSEPSVKIVTYLPWILYSMCRECQLKVTGVFSVYDYLVHTGKDRVNMDIMKYRRSNPVGVIRRYRSYYDEYLTNDSIDKTDAGYLARRQDFYKIAGYNYLPLFINGIDPLIKTRDGKVIMRSSFLDDEDLSYNHDGAMMVFSIIKPRDKGNDILQHFLKRCTDKNIWISEPGIRLLCLNEEKIQFYVTDDAYKDFYDYAVVSFLDIGDALGLDVQISAKVKAVSE